MKLIAVRLGLLSADGASANPLLFSLTRRLRWRAALYACSERTSVRPPVTFVRMAARVTANKTAKAEFTAKVLPVIDEIRSAGVQTLQGLVSVLVVRVVDSNFDRGVLQPLLGKCPAGG